MVLEKANFNDKIKVDEKNMKASSTGPSKIKKTGQQ